MVKLCYTGGMKITAKDRGFTIVELLIVIVVIGILAGIVMVAYSNVSARADNARRLANLKQWQQLLMVYRATNGSSFIPTETPLYADSDTAYYCLGTDFPDNHKCWNSWGSTNVAGESASLMNALKTVGSLPPQYYNDHNLPDGFGYGPLIAYNVSGGAITDIDYISDWFHGTTCPAGTIYHWSSDEYNVATCELQFNRQ